MLLLVLADLVDGHDVRVIQAGGRLGFPLEPSYFVGAGEAARVDHFKRDSPLEADLPGAIDLAHSARTDYLAQFVIAKMVDALGWAFCGRAPSGNRRLVLILCQ